MEFFKKRVRNFQENKLNEILDKIKFHTYMKNQLEKKIDGMEFDKTTKIREEIAFNEKMIEVWQRNEEKLRRQMSEMEE